MTQYFDAAAEYACRQLITDFAEAADSQDYDRLRDILTGDAVFARPSDPDKPMQGVENIIAAYKKRPKERLSWHLLSNISVKLLNADEATGSCRILMFLADGSQPPVPGKGYRADGPQLMGSYTDRFVRTDQGWRIADRRGKVFVHT